MPDSTKSPAWLTPIRERLENYERRLEMNRDTDEVDAERHLKAVADFEEHCDSDIRRLLDTVERILSEPSPASPVKPQYGLHCGMFTTHAEHVYRPTLLVNGKPIAALCSGVMQ